MSDGHTISQVMSDGARNLNEGSRGVRGEDSADRGGGPAERLQRPRLALPQLSRMLSRKPPT